MPTYSIAGLNTKAWLSQHAISSVISPKAGITIGMRPKLLDVGRRAHGVKPIELHSCHLQAWKFSPVVFGTRLKYCKM